MDLAVKIYDDLFRNSALLLGDAMHKKLEAILRPRLSKIPPESRVLPPVRTLGYVLESARHCQEDEDELIRNMFAEILASACDSRKADKVHISFVEVVRQLSAYDALFILDAFTVNNDIPFIDVCLQIEPNTTKHKVAFEAFTGIVPHYKAQLAVSNLGRLGVLSCVRNKGIAEGDPYKALMEHPFVADIFSKHKEPSLFHFGVASLTPFGRRLLSVCLPAGEN